MKLTREQANEIRAAYPNKRMPQLAREYGVTVGTIHAIIHNRRYTDNSVRPCNDLMPNEVEAIRDAYMTPYASRRPSQEQLAQQYNVSKATILSIVDGTFRYVI